ncbi:MAG TPA: sigma-54 dependent transcriptional regulator [Thermoanaerobaculia bacterium]|nr:sigma-54 dependent transcriptional regulator [Thermoanaerobaculia bacterium]
MASILIVEDDSAALAALASVVENEGHEVLTAATLAGAQSTLKSRSIDLVLADFGLPDGNGLDLLEPSADYDLAIITGQATLSTAIDALRRGAVDYLTKPIDVARLRALLSSFERTVELRSEVSTLREELRDAGRFGAIVGNSEPMRQVYNLIEKVAKTDATVFITGESGTGKELVAETIHRMSPRRKGELLPLNCGAVSPTLIESELFGHEKGSFTGAERRHAGHFERASGGTLFLDEITEMPIELQVKLLRVLETGTFLRVGGTKPQTVDVRVVAASNQDAAQAVDEGRLREDLYYRLRVFPIHLPPLRDRGPDDIELLARSFLAELGRRDGTTRRLTDEALELLTSYSWPGNVRELKNAIERANILAEDSIDADCLSREVRMQLATPQSGPYIRVRIGSSLEESEKRLILATLDELDGNRKETASTLGISPKTLYNRLKSYGVNRKSEHA